MGTHVEWREDGHQLSDHDLVVVLRFGTAEEHANVKAAITAAADYPDDLLTRAGHTADDVPLVLSCFAVTEEWTPQRLADGTNYRMYRVAAADHLQREGFALWPTNVYLDGVADPRNEVHYDLVVTIARPEQVQATLTGSSAARRQGREALAEPFRKLFELLGEAREIEPDQTSEE